MTTLLSRKSSANINFVIDETTCKGKIFLKFFINLSSGETYEGYINITGDDDTSFQYSHKMISFIKNKTAESLRLGHVTVSKDYFVVETAGAACDFNCKINCTFDFADIRRNLLDLLLDKDILTVTGLNKPTSTSVTNNVSCERECKTKSNQNVNNMLPFYLQEQCCEPNMNSQSVFGSGKAEKPICVPYNNVEKQCSKPNTNTQIKIEPKNVQKEPVTNPKDKKLNSAPHNSAQKQYLENLFKEMANVKKNEQKELPTEPKEEKSNKKSKIGYLFEEMLNKKKPEPLTIDIPKIKPIAKLQKKENNTNEQNILNMFPGLVNNCAQNSGGQATNVDLSNLEKLFGFFGGNNNGDVDQKLHNDTYNNTSDDNDWVDDEETNNTSVQQKMLNMILSKMFKDDNQKQ